MGGKGSGGIRVGSGRKSKGLAEKVLHGTASLKEQRDSGVGAISPTGPVTCPTELGPAESELWSRLAPLALALRTLTPATADAFADLCRNRVLMLEVGRDPDQRGGPNHRGLLQRVQSQMKDFSLSPFGKPIIGEAPKVEDPFAELDATVN